MDPGDMCETTKFPSKLRKVHHKYKKEKSYNYLGSNKKVQAKFDT